MGEHVEYVMIPKEEYDKILNCRIYETAKEILTEFYIYLPQVGLTDGLLNDLAKMTQTLADKYGIELE